MKKIMNLSYKGMAIANIAKERLIETLLKKKDGGKNVLEDNGLLVIGFVFMGLLLTFGGDWLKDLYAKITAKSSSWMGM